MHKLKPGSAWLLVIILSVFAGACGREQSGFVAPSVISTIPANLATNVPITQVVTATFNNAMNPTTINTVTFTVAPPSGVAIAGAVTYSNVTATFTPGANLLPSTVYTASISAAAKDPAGNALAGGYVWTFTTGAIPTVTSAFPLNLATGVPLNQAISAAFSEAMNPATLTTATFTVTPAGGASVAGTVAYVAASNTAIFTPGANLAANTVYRATITTGAMSAGGDALAANYSWTFTTGATTNASAPTITSTAPMNGGTGVPLNQIVSAIFSSPMNAATINGTTFTLTGPGATSVAGTVTYVVGSNDAIFKPTANLLPNTTYTATVTTGAQNLAVPGIALAAGAVPNPWTFTTGTSADTTPPTITLTNPVDGATGVPLYATVNATFSEAMNPATLTTTTFTVKGPLPGQTPVIGTVTYNPGTFVAMFTPTSPLAANTQYTADVTTGAQDQSGNALAAGTIANPWVFTTGAATGPAPINLGSASTFGDFGGTAGMTNQGILTMINNGNIGTTAVSTAVTGFHDPGTGCTYTETTLNMGAVSGLIYTAPPNPTVACPTEGTSATYAVAQVAAADTLAAYNSLAALPPGSDPGSGQLGGLTLAPGVYTSASGSFLLTGTNLTLDAQGNANAVWVFQMSTSLTVGGPGAPRSVILINGAQAQNVFWQVGSAATINGAGGGIMVGTIIAYSGVTFSTAGNSTVTTLDGRALSLVGSVTMVNTVVNVP